jgi:hypothetical protein
VRDVELVCIGIVIGVGLVDPVYIINDVVGTRADAIYEALKKSGVLREFGEL